MIIEAFIRGFSGGLEKRAAPQPQYFRREKPTRESRVLINIIKKLLKSSGSKGPSAQDVAMEIKKQQINSAATTTVGRKKSRTSHKRVRRWKSRRRS